MRLARTAGLLALAFPVVLLAAEQGAAPWGAIGYVEYPTHGPYEKGRALTTGGRGRFGVDVDSRIEIKVDTSKLESAVRARAPAVPAVEARVLALKERLQSLAEAAKGIKEAISGLQLLVQLCKTPNCGDKETFRSALQRSASQRLRIIDALLRAQQQRLRATGLSDEEAEKVSEAALAPALGGPTGYNWGAMETLFQQEINYAEQELAATAPDLGAVIQVRAHLLRAGTDPVALALPGYNDETTGVEHPFERLRFYLSENEKAMYDQYQQMAKETKETRDIAQAILASLQQEFDRLRVQLTTVTAELRVVFTAAQDRLQVLADWTKPGKRKKWLDDIKVELDGSSQGKEVAANLKTVQADLAAIQDDVKALKSYADLGKRSGGITAPDAMDIITAIPRLIDSSSDVNQNPALRALQAETWSARGEHVRALLTSVEQLGGPLRDRIKQEGPVADLQASLDALEKLAEVAKRTPAQVHAWIRSVLLLEGSTKTASEFPEPKGQKSLAIRTGAELSTEFNLLTTSVALKERDTVRVEYRFFRGEKPITGGWHDDFVLSAYGWRSDVFASLAFAKHNGDATWKPAPAVSWIVTRRLWPKSGELGTSANEIRWFSGAGLSALTLNQVEGQDVEFGLAATLSFFDDHIFVGYGANLQADRNGSFAFISLRLFTFSGSPVQAAGVR
jgi:hypothetical protein